MKKRIGCILAVILIVCIGAAVMLACKPVEPVGPDNPWNDAHEGQYMLKYIHRGGSGEIPAIEYYKPGDTVILKAADTFTRKDFEFVCWSDGENQYDAETEYTMPAHHVQMEACWDSLLSGNVTLRYDANGGVGDVPIAERVPKNSEIVLPNATLTREGYTFLGWSDGTSNLNPGATYTVPARNVTIRARWKMANPVLGSSWVWGLSDKNTSGNDAVPVKTDVALRMVDARMYCFVLRTNSETGDLVFFKAVRLSTETAVNRTYASADETVSVDFASEKLTLKLTDVDGVVTTYTFDECEPLAASSATGKYSYLPGKDEGAALEFTDNKYACKLTLGMETFEMAAIEINGYYALFESNDTGTDLLNENALMYARDNGEGSITLVNTSSETVIKYTLTKAAQ